MRALLAGVFLSVVLQAQFLPVGPAKARRVIPTEKFQLLIVKQVAPEYPDEAQASRMVGDVLLMVQINEKGNLQDIKVMKGPAPLREAAIDALKRWRFRALLRR